MPSALVQTKQNKSLQRELPYFGQNISYCHGQFNNLIAFSDLPSKNYLERLPSLHDIDIFSLNLDAKSNSDSEFTPFRPIRCKYYSPHSFSLMLDGINRQSESNLFSLIHNNVRSLKHNVENFQNHLLSELNHHFNVIGVTETRIRNANFTFNPSIPGYNFEFVPTPLSAGGVGMYIDTNFRYNVIEKNSNEAFQALWIEIHFSNKANIICGVIYRQHNSPESFHKYFDETIENLSASGKHIYIMGDTNINLLHSSSCNYAQNFLCSLQSFGLIPTIDKPTRVHNNSASLIDNIFTNKLDDEITSGNVISDISDHFTQFCIMRSPGTKLRSREKRYIRDYSHFSEDNFLRDLSDVKWQDLTSEREQNVDKLFSTFYNKLNKVVNRHAPFKPISKRKMKTLLKPWITKGIRKSIRTKNKLLALGDREQYKLYRNKISNLTRLSKKLYFHQYFQDNINNAKKTWEGINNLINRRKKSRKTISAIKRQDNHLSYDPLEYTNILNSHFASVGQKLASNIPKSNKTFSQYLTNLNYSGSFSFEPVLPRDIEIEIFKIPSNKTHGLYSCPTRLLKSAGHIIAVPLASIINISVEKGVFPTKLKHAKITPVFKDGDETDPNNYRPISLLSIFNRIFEKVMCDQLKRFMNKHNILYESQYGFRENRSTEHAILDIVNKIQKNMGRGMFSCGIFIDLKKAFDTVDHSILLQKLHHYGIRGIINDWFHSYLYERTQSTQIGPHISKKEKTLSGVPQGSVLGPLLFLIYINDIYNASSKLAFYLFADDTNLLYADKNLKSLESVINVELINICDWLNANKLSLNIQKTNFVIFHPYQKRLNYEVNLKIFDNRINKFISLERKDYVKYLGVLIDGNLSWKYHICHVASKVSRNIGIIARLRHFTPSATLHNIYRSLISPYLSYGLSAWGQAAKIHLDKILLLQKRVVRLMNFAKFSEHAIPLFLSSHIMPLNILYFKLSSTLMFDVHNKSVPSNISDLFTSTQEIHHYNTRSSSSGSFYIKYTRLNHQKNSLSCTGAKIWNSIPENLKQFSKRRFKKKMNELLFQILQKQTQKR